MLYMVTRWFGVFLYDEKEIKDMILFPKNADEIANRLYRISKGEIIEEEIKFEKYKPIVKEKRLLIIGKEGKFKEIKINAEKFGYGKNLLREACIKLSIKKIEEEQKKREKRIVEAVNAIEDIIKVTNILLERVRSWYEYFSFDEEIDGIFDLKIGEEEIDKQEEKNLKNIAKVIQFLNNTRDELQNYIKIAMEEIAPNLTELVGYSIASKLVAKAGGIERLAKMPASTIQLLGAERALFRHLKDGLPPPKHGIIFQHEMVNKAPKNKRGKIARMIASKISIACKADAFTGNKIGEKLKKEMEEEYKEIIQYFRK
ncbi:MAG: NOP5/NOP56 family protein [Candidatus Thermoplasmatota archaeon]